MITEHMCGKAPVQTKSKNPDEQNKPSLLPKANTHKAKHWFVPEGIGAILIDDRNRIWIILFSFAHFLAITCKVQERFKVSQFHGYLSLYMAIDYLQTGISKWK